MFDSLRPHGLQHTRRPCAFLSPGVCSNSWLFIELMMLSNHFVFCRPLFLLPLIFPSIRVFSSESAFRIRWPKYWSFSISPSNEYSRLFSFMIDGLISLQSKGVSRSFSSIIIQKYQFFGAQPSLWSNSHLSFPCSSAGKESTCNAGDLGLLAITVHSDFGAQEKIFHSYFFPFYLSWSYRTGYHDLSFFNVGSFKAALSLSSLILI